MPNGWRYRPTRMFPKKITWPNVTQVVREPGLGGSEIELEYVVDVLGEVARPGDPGPAEVQAVLGGPDRPPVQLALAGVDRVQVEEPGDTVSKK